MRAVVAVALLLPSLPALARPGAGTLADPILVDDFPYAAKGDTTSGGHDLNGYSCAAQDESGGERVYRFTLAAPAKLSAWLEYAAPVDVDVQILADDTRSGSSAASCVARGDVIAEAQLDAGTHYVVVDTFTSDEHAGPYVLHLEAIGDQWISRTLAAGVTWRARRFSGVGGGPQVVNELVVDPTVTGVQVKALAATGCQTVAALGASSGAVAGTNGGFFGGASCAPASLLKSSGTLIAKNPSASMRGAFGVSPSAQPLVALVGQNADWPAALDAHGAGPILAQAGAPRMGSASWGLEGFTDAGFLGVNPRTFAGFDAGQLIHLGTVDGRRTTSAVGISLDALAALLVSSELGLSDAVNLDGSGSTTLWIAGATPNGVVNYPSDFGTTEDAGHPSARATSGGWFVLAAPYDHPPRFQTTPPTDATVGTPYVYDADAIDLDVNDPLGFSLTAPPPGVSVDSDGVVQFLPAADDVPDYALTLVVSDGRGGSASQSWTVHITGATGNPNDDAAAPADAAADDSPDLARHGSGAHGGCSVAAGHAPLPLFFLLLLCAAICRRRAHA